ncbi:MAG: hypothetical protein AAF907_04300, partial [Planctomycetota bacterium]
RHPLRRPVGRLQVLRRRTDRRGAGMSKEPVVRSVGSFGWWQTADRETDGWDVREDDAALRLEVPVRRSLLLWLRRRGPQTVLLFDKTTGRIDLPLCEATVELPTAQRWQAEIIDDHSGGQGQGLRRPRVNLWLVTETEEGLVRYAVAARGEGWTMRAPLASLVAATGLPTETIDDTGISGWGFKLLAEELRAIQPRGNSASSSAATGLTVPEHDSD